jgi:hypothetical protein
MAPVFEGIPAAQRISPGTTTASRANRDTQSDRDLRRMLAGFWKGSRSALKTVSKQTNIATRESSSQKHCIR